MRDRGAKNVARRGPPPPRPAQGHGGCRQVSQGRELRETDDQRPELNQVAAGKGKPQTLVPTPGIQRQDIRVGSDIA